MKSEKIAHFLNSALDELFKAKEIAKEIYGETDQIYQELSNIYSYLPNQLQITFDKINIKSAGDNKEIVEENIFLVPIIELEEGQFSNEKSVILKMADGEKISLFAQNEWIHYCSECKTPFLKTTLVKKSEKENVAQVLLPDEALETQSKHADFTLNRNII